MTNKEAIKILTQAKEDLIQRNGKTVFCFALIKAIAALVEKDEREQKAKALKEQHKNKCRDCKQFGFGDGGLNPCYGNCALRDAPFDFSRNANNRACKQFEYDEEAADNE